jgi:hypothetical protein
VGAHHADHETPLYRKNLALNSPTSGRRLVGIIRLQTKAKKLDCGSFYDSRISSVISFIIFTAYDIGTLVYISLSNEHILISSLISIDYKSVVVYVELRILCVFSRCK